MVETQTAPSTPTSSTSFHDLNESSLSPKLKNVAKVYIVLSGKGGVGKTRVAYSVAKTLAKTLSNKVCLLDLDINGPSIPQMIGIEATNDRKSNDIRLSNDDIRPINVAPNFSVLSIGFLINKNQSVILRGPAKTRLVEKFLNACMLKNIDYLIIDTPPGSSDEHIAAIEFLRNYNPDGSILVTTPQTISVEDVQKEVNYCRKAGLPIVGVVENMSFFKCPNCSTETPIFSEGGGKALARHYGLKFICQLPMIMRKIGEANPTPSTDVEELFDRNIENLCKLLEKEV